MHKQAIEELKATARWLVKLVLGSSTLVEEHVHYWVIDSSNVGRCRYCPEVRDFGKLLRRESKLLGLTAKSGGNKGELISALTEAISQNGKGEPMQLSLTRERARAQIIENLISAGVLLRGEVAKYGKLLDSYDNLTLARVWVVSRELRAGGIANKDAE